MEVSLLSRPACNNIECVNRCVCVFVYAEGGGELGEAVWNLSEKYPDLVQTQKEPGPAEQHQEVLRGLVRFYFP